jgi:hypothetical protein
MRNPPVRMRPHWNRALRRAVLPIRSALNCKLLQWSEWIASKRQERLNLNACSKFCPKRLLELLEGLPQQLALHRAPKSLVGRIRVRQAALQVMELQGRQRLCLARSEANIIPAPAGAPTAGMGQDTSSKQDERPARKKDWILSDTTSPVDFSPLVTAVIRATSDVKDGPNSFVVRCRSQHTEVSIRTDEAWSTPRGNELVVEYQINDQPMVRQPWMLSADGKTATYRNDPVELLRSVPEGATMKIAVTDKSNVRHETTFELTGLSGVRQKVGTSCNWASLNAKTSSSRR